MPAPRHVLVSRTLVFLFVAGFIVAGPIWKQGLDRPSEILFQWVMFSGFGTDVCDVRYVVAEPDGTRTRVDRYALLGHEDRDAAPRSVKKLKDVAAAKALGKRLCKKLPEGTDLRLRARCATRKGWRWESKAEENLCSRR